MLRIICLISVGLLLLSTTVSGDGDVPGDDNVRVPRALVLKPVVKVKTHHDDDDDGPFDFIADWISKLVNPHKPSTPAPLRLLVPSINGISDELYIEHLTPSPHTKSSFVIIRVSSDAKNPPHGNPPGGGTTPYHPKPIFPSGSTRFIPKPSGNFFPVAPTVPSWPRPSTAMDRPLIPNHMNAMHMNAMHMNNLHMNNIHMNNMQGYDYNQPSNYGSYNQRNYPNHKNYMPMKFGPNTYNFKPPFSPHLQPPFRSHDRFPQNPYGVYDFHNSIPGASGGSFHHGMESFKPTNYPSYSSFPGVLYNNNSLHTLGSEQVKVTLENVDLPLPPTTALPSISDHNQLDNVNRLDRMISTSSQLTNYSTKLKSSTTTTTTPSPHLEQNRNNDFKYSSQEIQEISPPDLLQTWKKLVAENEDKHVMKISKDAELHVDEKMTEKSRRDVQNNTNDNQLMKTRISEMIKRRNRKTTTNRRSVSTFVTTPVYNRNSDKRAEKLVDRVTEKIQLDSSVLSNNANDFYKVENITLRSIENVMNLTASGSWKNRETRKPDKLYERLKNNHNKKIRVVESVKSSVSVIKSKDKQ
ncbi:GATA zinc finger domain-containing protein 11-like [Chelonus insularis]|uniref:GATA zinc finger domain-containing protein 11-like n=1 Tax=Chelonus insularis TaxID=460826 RepID=UPI00158CBEA6|nr:GATA zinc finger domain-containing protein 11-like [Chelonus insularis]